MADTTTTNYGFVKPEVGASASTWGGKINGDMDTIDTTIKAVSDVAGAALVKASNLSDLTNASTARTNLGVPTGTSGANLGFLNGSNTNSGTNTHSGANTFSNTVTNSGYQSNTGGRSSTINAQTGATYAFVLADAGRVVYNDRTSGTTWTLPAVASVAYPVGTQIHVASKPVTGGVISLPNSNVFLYFANASVSSVSIAAGGLAILTHIETDKWLVTGLYGVT